MDVTAPLPEEVRSWVYIYPHLHALTAHPSNTVYVNFEQSAKRRSGQLSQESVDRAFANRQRRTNYIFAYRDTEIAILSGKQTGRLGVIKKQTSGGDSVDVTNIERTLVDITVRPDYSLGWLQDSVIRSDSPDFGVAESFSTCADIWIVW